MYLRYLHYLQSVIDQGSFARAAQACGVSQPAISQGMKALQAQFDAPLLVRDGRRYVPTDLARRVVAEGAPLAQRIDALPQALRAAVDRNRLRVGLTASAALVCGPLLYEAWCLPQPQRSLEMTTADEGSLLTGLLHGSFDAVIAPRPRHPLAQARSLADLQGAAWGCAGPSVSGPVDVLTEAHRVRRMPAPRMAVRCPDFASLLNLVVGSDLLAVLPHPALLGAAAEQVVPLQLAEALPLYGMWLFERKARKPRLGPEVFAGRV